MAAGARDADKVLLARGSHSEQIEARRGRSAHLYVRSVEASADGWWNSIKHPGRTEGPKARGGASRCARVYDCAVDQSDRGDRTSARAGVGLRRRACNRFQRETL